MEKRKEIDYASRNEAVAALESLDKYELLKLEQIAKNRTFGLELTEWNDLLQTALERVVAGSRRWPKDVQILVFLGQVMKSLAHEYRQQNHRAADAGIRREADFFTTEGLEQESIVESACANRLNPEQQLLVQEKFDSVEMLLGDNEDALAIVMARAEGFSPSEIQESFDMTKIQYASGVKYIRRKLRSVETEKAV